MQIIFLLEIKTNKIDKQTNKIDKQINN